MERAPAGGPPLVASVVLLLLGGAAFWYSSSQDVLLGRIAAPILMMAAMHGLWRGGFFKLALLPFAFCVPYLAAAHSDLADPVVKAVTGSSNGLISSITMGATAMVVLLIARALVKRFRRRHIATRRVALSADRFVGTGVGVAEGAFIVLCICWLAVMLHPHAAVVRDHPDTKPDSFRHQVAGALIRLADELSNEPLAGVVKATNLIERTPVLRDAINNLNATGQFDIDSLDPDVRSKLGELLQAQPGGELGDLDTLIDKYRRGNEARDKAYREMEALRNRDH